VVIPQRHRDRGAAWQTRLCARRRRATDSRHEEVHRCLGAEPNGGSDPVEADLSARRVVRGPASPGRSVVVERLLDVVRVQERLLQQLSNVDIGLPPTDLRCDRHLWQSGSSPLCRPAGGSATPMSCSPARKMSRHRDECESMGQ
jgi:hypothetical protein